MSVAEVTELGAQVKEEIERDELAVVEAILLTLLQTARKAVAGLFGVLVYVSLIIVN